MKQLLRVAAALVATSALLGPAAAFAADPTPSPTPSFDPDSYIEYTGTYSGTYYNIDGVDQSTFSQEQPVRIQCTDEGCTFWGIPLGGEGEFPIDGATGEWTRGNQGTLCETGTFIAGGTMTVTATAETITATIEQNGAEFFCPNEIQQFGTHSTYVGTYVSGNPCVLDGAPCPPQPTESAIPIAAPGADAPASGPRTAAAPSILSTLAVPAETLAPSQVALAVMLTIVLVILMALPTHLLNGAIEKGSDRLASVLKRVRKPERGWSGLVPAALGVLAAGLISCFVDPRFGFDLASLRTLASVLVSFIIDIGLGWLAVILLVRRLRPGVAASFRFAPLSLLIVVATVVFTRLTGFEPGIVFGLVAGVAFGALAATADKARVALTGLAWAFVLAILAWIGYALLGTIPEPGAALVFLRETLSSMTIAGVAALPIALIPLRGLTGYDVWQWSRWVWGGAYALGLLGFFLVLMPMPFAWGGVHVSLVTWIVLYLAYAAVAVVLWLIVTKPWARGTNEA